MTISPVLRFLARLCVVLIGLVAAFVVIAWFGGVILQIDRQSPDRQHFKSLEVILPKGDEVILGREQLGQVRGASSAARNHIALRADATTGLVTISRVTSIRRLQLSLDADKGALLSNRVMIPHAAGNMVRIVLDDEEIVIDAHENGALTVHQKAAGVTRVHRIRRDGAARSGGARPGLCAPEGRDWKDKGTRAMRETLRLPVWLGMNVKRHVALFGGTQGLKIATPCELRSGAVFVPLTRSATALEIVLQNDTKAGFATVHVQRSPATGIVRFYRTEAVTEPGRLLHLGARGFPWPVRTETDRKGLIEVTGFIAGRTKYDIRTTERTATHATVLISTDINEKVPVFHMDGCVDGLDDTGCLVTGKQKIKDVSLDISAEEVAGPLDRLVLGLQGEHLRNTERLFWGLLLAILICFAIIARKSWGNYSPRLRPVAQVCFWGTLALTLVPLLPTEVIAAFGDLAGGLSASRLLLLALQGTFLLASVPVILGPDGDWKLTVYWLAMLFIILLGATSIFTLSAESPTSNWDRFAIKHFLLVLWLVPLPVALAASIAMPAVRQSLGRDFSGRMTWVSPSRMILLLSVVGFSLWILIGNQQGVGGLQPVEFGKSVTMLALAILATQAFSRGRLLGDHSGRLAVGAVISVLSFFFVLLVAPVVRNDYSPLIIVASTTLIVIAVVWSVTLLRLVVSRLEDNRRLQDMPLRFVPRLRRGTLHETLRARLCGLPVLGKAFRNGDGVSQRFWTRYKLKNTGPLAALLAACLIVLPIAFMLQNKAVHFGAKIPGWSWTDSSKEQIDAVTEAIGDSRYLLGGRLIGWADLRFDATRKDEIGVGHPDLGLQVVRSRVAIASAPCGLSPSLNRDASRDATERLVPLLAWVAACDLQPAVWPRPQSATAGCDYPRIFDPIPSHCIPVVQSDFAATFLLQRHGLSAGLVLVLAQIVVTVLGAVAALKLLSRSSRDIVAGAADLGLATLALGFITLQALQWTLAWSNAFGLLPVMGQPMTWLSTATSHLLFMAIPAIVVMVLTFRLGTMRQETVSFRWVPRL